MPASAPRWRNVPLPHVQSTIYFIGICSRIRPDGVLELTLDDIQFNISQHAYTPSSDAASQPPTKRQKFDALAFSSYVPSSRLKLTSHMHPVLSILSTSLLHPQARSPLLNLRCLSLALLHLFLHSLPHRLSLHHRRLPRTLRILHTRMRTLRVLLKSARWRDIAHLRTLHIIRRAGASVA